MLHVNVPDRSLLSFDRPNMNELMQIKRILKIHFSHDGSRNLRSGVVRHSCALTAKLQNNYLS